MPDTLLSKGSQWRVRFAFEDDRYVDVYFDEHGRLILHAGSFATLAVRPMVANQIEVEAVK